MCTDAPRRGFTPDWPTLLIGLLVIGLMSFWPQKWNARFPASLSGIILTTPFIDDLPEIDEHNIF